MSEKEIKKNPCGDDKEIDEYLNGTICEVAIPEEDLNDLKAPSDDEFEVDEKAEPAEIEDEYMKKS
ncbi:MAG TPA: hypothetical protein PKA19_05665 [Bacillota bacterium]|nr:hypothetical protein [Bacillota bacterium]